MTSIIGGFVGFTTYAYTGPYDRIDTIEWRLSAIEENNRSQQQDIDTMWRKVYNVPDDEAR